MYFWPIRGVYFFRLNIFKSNFKDLARMVKEVKDKNVMDVVDKNKEEGGGHQDSR